MHWSLRPLRLEELRFAALVGRSTNCSATEDRRLGVPSPWTLMVLEKRLKDATDGALVETAGEDDFIAAFRRVSSASASDF